MRKLPSGNWTHQLMVDGKRISVTAPTKAEVEYQVAEYKTKRKAKTGLTVRDCVESYINLCQNLSPTTLHSYKNTLAYGFQHIMELPVDSLDNVIMQNAINVESKRVSERTGKPLSAKSIKNEWGLISSSLKTVANRTYQIKLPKIQRVNKELPEPEVILQAIKGTDIELPCLLAMWCGMRMSEIRGLTFDSIHKDYISIDKVMVDVDNKSQLKNLAKTDLSIRKVPMPNYIKGLIKTHGKAKNDLVVPITRNTLYHRFTKLMSANDINISFHDLRHEYASIMLTKLQVPEKVVQKSGGWKTDTVMKTVYSNTFSESDKQASQIRDKYFEDLLNY